MNNPVNRKVIHFARGVIGAIVSIEGNAPAMKLTGEREKCFVSNGTCSKKRMLLRLKAPAVDCSGFIYLRQGRRNDLYWSAGSARV